IKLDSAKHIHQRLFFQEECRPSSAGASIGRRDSHLSAKSDHLVFSPNRCSSDTGRVEKTVRREP
ncbi:hypothetical protein KIN13_19730, partial [Vibrio cholerae]